MAKIIKHQLFFPNPPEVVWEYLTDPALLAQWIMPNDFKPVVGHEFKFTTGPQPANDFDGIFYCKILEITLFETLSYSWKFGPGDGSLNESVVNWTLTAQENGTELVLVHNQFAGANFIPLFDGMSKGWAVLIQKMLQKIQTATDGPAKA